MALYTRDEVGGWETVHEDYGLAHEMRANGTLVGRVHCGRSWTVYNDVGRRLDGGNPTENVWHAKLLVEKALFGGAVGDWATDVYGWVVPYLGHNHIAIRVDKPDRIGAMGPADDKPYRWRFAWPMGDWLESGWARSYAEAMEEADSHLRALGLLDSGERMADEGEEADGDVKFGVHTETTVTTRSFTQVDIPRATLLAALRKAGLDVPGHAIIKTTANDFLVGDEGFTLSWADVKSEQQEDA